MKKLSAEHKKTLEAIKAKLSAADGELEGAIRLLSLEHARRGGGLRLRSRGRRL